MKTEQWGSGPFDNIPAQDAAFELVEKHASSSTRFLQERLGHFGSASIRDCQALIGLAEAINVASGQSQHGDACPLVVRWARNAAIQRPDQSIRSAFASRLRSIAAKSKLRAALGKDKKQQSQWQAAVGHTADQLESRGRKKAPGAVDLSLPAFKKLFLKTWGKREPNTLYPMAKRSKEMHVDIGFLDAETAIKMTRYPAVTSVHFDFDLKGDESRMLVPVQLLLRGWRRSIEALECDVSSKDWQTTIFSKSAPEISELLNLERISTVCAEVPDELIEALSTCPKLTEIRVSAEQGPTGAALDSLSRHPRLRLIWIRGSRISKQKAAAFRRANPRVVLDVG
jgi:hypothetical protein